MSELVLVTQPEFGKGQGVFRHAGDLRIEPAPEQEDGLAQLVRAEGCRLTIIGSGSYVGPLYDALAETAGPEGAIIARFGVGHDGIAKDLARQRRIVVTNTPGVLDVSVAEHTLSLMLALARRTASLGAGMRAGRYQPQTGTELRGKVLGIIGFGAIGRRVAAAAHFGLGMNVLAADIRPVPELEKAEGTSMEGIKACFGLALYTTDVDAVLREADVVSIHMPGTDATRRFFDARRLAVMKRGAFLINTARGTIVDECALYDAMADGRLGGAALDVFEREPYVPVGPDKDLRKLEGVLLTPHVGSDTREANARMAQVCLKNVRSFLAGRRDELDRVDL